MNSVEHVISQSQGKSGNSVRVIVFLSLQLGLLFAMSSLQEVGAVTLAGSGTPNLMQSGEGGKGQQAPAARPPEEGSKGPGPQHPNLPNHPRTLFIVSVVDLYRS
jgi:hypothetical protein